jgi:hypothetical protein
MIIRSIIAAIVLGFLFCCITFAEPAPENLIGKVQIRNPAKLDGQAKKEIAAIAAKIKKQSRNGTVKLIGDVPSASSPDDYLTNSFLLAKEVQIYLKTLLSNKYQIFLTASRHSTDKREEKNYVSIFLHPYELKAEGLRFISSQLRIEDMGAGPVVSVPDEPIDEPTAASTSQFEPVLPADSALSSPERPDYQDSSRRSKKERARVETEDAIQANELVNKAKARAAEKAKRQESQD